MQDSEAQVPRLLVRAMVPSSAEPGAAAQRFAADDSLVLCLWQLVATMPNLEAASVGPPLVGGVEVDGTRAFAVDEDVELEKDDYDDVEEEDEEGWVQGDDGRGGQFLADFDDPVPEEWRRRTYIQDCEAQWQAQGGRCFYCLRPMKGSGVLNHFIPDDQPGTPDKNRELSKDIRNKVSCCRVMLTQLLDTDARTKTALYFPGCSVEVTNNILNPTVRPFDCPSHREAEDPWLHFARHAFVRSRLADSPVADFLARAWLPSGMDEPPPVPKANKRKKATKEAEKRQARKTFAATMSFSEGEINRIIANGGRIDKSKNEGAKLRERNGTIIQAIGEAREAMRELTALEEELGPQGFVKMIQEQVGPGVGANGGAEALQPSVDSGVEGLRTLMRRTNAVVSPKTDSARERFQVNWTPSWGLHVQRLSADGLKLNGQDPLPNSPPPPKKGLEGPEKYKWQEWRSKVGDRITPTEWQQRRAELTEGRRPGSTWFPRRNNDNPDWIRS